MRRIALCSLFTLAAIVAGCVDDPEPVDDPASAPAPAAVGAEEAFPGQLGVPVTGVIETPDGPREVTYHDHDGVAIVEGDIRVRVAQPRGGRAPSAGRTVTSSRWPSGLVPYEIDPAFSATQRSDIIAALDHWNASTIYWFRPRAGEPDFVRFVVAAGCSAEVGRQGGRQDIMLGAGCGRGAIIHELGHAVGLWHEQSRADRDGFVNVLWGNVLPGRELNFQTYLASRDDGQDMFDYDFGSVMHYGPDAFSVNGLPTLSRVDGQPLVVQRDGLSPGDIAGATRLLTKNGPATFKLVNLHSGHCLDVAAASRSPNALVNQFTCHGLANQRWYLYSLPWANKSIVINDWSGLCLDIPNHSTANGVQVQQFPCHGRANQQFAQLPAPAGSGRTDVGLQVQHSAKCLDVPGWATASGTRVNQFTCNGGTNQRWRMVW